MVNVTVKEEDLSLSLEIKGHANFSEKGEDLVCAGVSSIVFGMLNVLNEFNYDFSYQIEDNFVYLSTSSKETKLMFEVMLIQLQTIENDYNEYIKIKR